MKHQQERCSPGMDDGCSGEGGRIICICSCVFALYLWYRNHTVPHFPRLRVAVDRPGFLVVQSPDVGLSFPRIHTASPSDFRPDECGDASLPCYSICIFGYICI